MGGNADCIMFHKQPSLCISYRSDYQGYDLHVYIQRKESTHRNLLLIIIDIAYRRMKYLKKLEKLES